MMGNALASSLLLRSPSLCGRRSTQNSGQQCWLNLRKSGFRKSLSLFHTNNSATELFRYRRLFRNFVVVVRVLLLCVAGIQ